MQNVDKQVRIKMKKNQTLKPTSEIGPQKKIPPEWKEMDELKNAIKDKGGENLDRMIRRTGSTFTTEVLNRPFLPKFYLPQLGRMMVPRISWITSNHSRH